jgi:hypothetical protein
MAPTRKKKLPCASCVVLRRLAGGEVAASASGADSCNVNHGQRFDSCSRQRHKQTNLKANVK